MGCTKAKRQSASAKTLVNASIPGYPSNLDYSEDKVQLQRWAYETSRGNLTFAENFEKMAWEKEELDKCTGEMVKFA
jgi:hypothetical protein